jgi:CBS domain-containing protein
MAAYTQSRPLTDVAVVSVLSGRIHTCSPADSIDQAVSVMRTQRIRRLVVVEGQKVVGVLALADVARHVAALAPFRRDAGLVLVDLLAALSEKPPGKASAGHAAE